MAAYYNELKPEAAHMLRQLIKDGLIADGEVDERSITEVTADDVKGYTQCHFFAGIGGWSVALRRAMWPDSRPVWTGSCPCQPFSTAGKQKGKNDDRHLWPIWFGLAAECRPPVIFGEQVSSAISHGWLDGVQSDLESLSYAVGSAVLPACSVDAPHKRDRLWFVAHSKEYDDRRIAGEIQSQNEQQASERQKRRNGASCNASGNMGNPKHNGRNGCQITGSDEAPVFGCAEGQDSTSQSEGAGDTGIISTGSMADTQDPKCPDAGSSRSRGSRFTGGGVWDNAEWIVCGDNKIRRIPSVESGICIVVNGVQHKAPLLHALGNAIVPEVAARFIQACM